MIDLHVHTWRCRHAEGSAAQYVRAAASTGVRTMAFTEHLPLAQPLLDRVPGAADYAMPLAELPEYCADVRHAAERGAEAGVEVLLGIEVDVVPVALSHARELLALRPFDIVLGSVHFIDDWAFDDPDRQETAAEWRIDELWERYFDDVIAAARTGVADVIAHADLVKKFCGRPPGPVDHLYREAASAFAEAGVAVEINTAGLRKPCGEIYPTQAFLACLHREGVPVTIGSDAHTPHEVGAGWAEACAALHDAGYRSVVVFRNRVAEEVGVDEL